MMSKNNKKTDDKIAAEAQLDEEIKVTDQQLDDNSSDQSPDSELERLQKERDDCKELSSRLQDQLKRAIADYQNLEKRVNEGRLELANWATFEVIKKLLPVFDHFEKALNGASEDEKTSGWYKGVEMAAKQFMIVLKDEGLEQVSVDGQFDPNLHEAIDTRIGKNGQVLEILEKGYTLNGKIVKPAKVVVGIDGDRPEPSDERD